MEPLDPCCEKEARRHLKRHRAIATCDSCGRLLLAYGNDLDYDRTVEELTDLAVDFRVGTNGKLRVVAKER